MTGSDIGTAVAQFGAPALAGTEPTLPGKVQKMLQKLCLDAACRQLEGPSRWASCAGYLWHGPYPEQIHRDSLTIRSSVSKLFRCSGAQATNELPERLPLVCLGTNSNPPHASGQAHALPAR